VALIDGVRSRRVGAPPAVSFTEPGMASEINSATAIGSLMQSSRSAPIVQSIAMPAGETQQGGPRRKIIVNLDERGRLRRAVRRQPRLADPTAEAETLLRPAGIPALDRRQHPRPENV
jgi:hypothetical protein